MCLRKKISGRRRDGNFETLTERYEAGVSAGRWDAAAVTQSHSGNVTVMTCMTARTV